MKGVWANLANDHPASSPIHPQLTKWQMRKNVFNGLFYFHEKKRKTKKERRRRRKSNNFHKPNYTWLATWSGNRWPVPIFFDFCAAPHSDRNGRQTFFQIRLHGFVALVITHIKCFVVISLWTKRSSRTFREEDNINFY